MNWALNLGSLSFFSGVILHWYLNSNIAAFLVLDFVKSGATAALISANGKFVFRWALLCSQ